MEVGRSQLLATAYTITKSPEDTRTVTRHRLERLVSGGLVILVLLLVHVHLGGGQIVGPLQVQGALPVRVADQAEGRKQ